MRIGIIGGGVVGQATAKSFIEHVDEVRVYDIVKEKRTACESDVYTFSDIIFVCLPTPQMPDSLKANLIDLTNFFAYLPDYAKTKNLVLRSTVPVGTTRMLREKYGLINLVHSPEFLTARCATLDAQMPSRNIVGVPERNGPMVSCEYGPLYDLYESRWQHVPVLKMTSDESESVKLMLNSFFAVKVAFWNEMRSYADKMRLNWDRVMGGILSDGRIHPSHTKVPGPDGKMGFGGTCLPKDLADMIDCINGVGGLSAPVCLAAYNRNRLIDRVGKQCRKHIPEGYSPCTREAGHDGPCAHPLFKHSTSS